MADVNHIILIGRLTRDAEIKYTAGGTAVSKFSIAFNRSVKRDNNWEDEANFIDIVLWGRQAESLNQYLLKGKQIAVDGELKQDRWQQDGQTRSKHEIVVNRVQLLGGGNSNGDSQRETRPGSSGKKPTQTYEQPNDDGFSDDIPF
jgi:single-strand DNA-binding protein